MIKHPTPLPAPTVSINRQRRRKIVASILAATIVILLVSVFGVPIAQRQFGFSLTWGTALTAALAVSALLIYIFSFLRQFNLHTLRAKMLIVFVAVTLLPIAVIGYYNDVVAQSLINRAARYELSETSKQTALQIDAYILSQLNSIRTEAQQPALRDYLQLSPNQRKGSRQETSVTQILAVFSRKDPLWIRSYALLDIQGINVLDTLEVRKGADESKFDYFSQPQVDGLAYISSVLFPGKPSFYVSAVVRDEKGQTIGVLRAEYNAAVFQNILLSILPETGTGNFLTVVDKNTYLRIADTGGSQNLYKSFKNMPLNEISNLQLQYRMPPGTPENLLSPSDPFVSGMDHLSQTRFFTAYSDSLKTDALVTGTPLNNAPWIVMEGRSTTALSLPIEDQRRNTILIAMLILIFAMLLALVATQWIAQPVINLTAVAKKITDGELEVQAAQTTQDEIGTLARAFNAMTARLRETLAGLESDLHERKKLIDELERFTYTVSHDLKSPLVTISGFLGYLEKDAASGNLENHKKDSKRIQDAVAKMQSLLEDLLELSRLGRLMNPPEIISFNDLVREAMDNVHGRFEARGVTVQILTPQGTQPGLPPVYGDHQRLTEVLQNLLDNAAKYMGDQPNPHIEIGQRGEKDGKPIFYVKDNGIGIAPEYHERVFGLFNKLNPLSEGTGIGLALVKRIIEVHGGQIWVESEAGQGSTFCFTLPVHT